MNANWLNRLWILLLKTISCRSIWESGKTLTYNWMTWPLQSVHTTLVANAWTWCNTIKTSFNSTSSGRSSIRVTTSFGKRTWDAGHTSMPELARSSTTCSITRCIKWTHFSSLTKSNQNQTSKYYSRTNYQFTWSRTFWRSHSRRLHHCWR